MAELNDLAELDMSQSLRKSGRLVLIIIIYISTNSTGVAIPS